MALILPGNVASATAGGYEVANSCRFNGGDSAKFNIDHSGAGSLVQWTMSMWVKRSGLGAEEPLFNCRPDSNNETFVGFASGDTLVYKQKLSGSTTGQIVTNRVFRDVSAWYHFVFVYDTGNGTAGDRGRLYVNGVEETSFSAETTFAGNSSFNSTDTCNIGNSQSAYFDGYMAEVVFIDGAALAPTSFGEFDEDSPTIWKPINVSGLTPGTNGLWLDFEDSSNLGNNAFGSGSADWTETNIAAADQATDTPTNNFATLNPLINKSSGVPTIAEGNLLLTTNSEEFGSVSSIGVSSGKWYCETKFVSGSYGHFGITGAPILLSTVAGAYAGADTESWGWNYSGAIMLNDVEIDTYSTFATGDVIGIGLDLDNNNLYLAKNGTWEESGDPTSGATGTGALSITAPASVTEGAYFIFVGNGASAANATVAANFGGCPPFAISSGNADADGYGNFEYAVPSGYFALCTKNLAEYG